MGSNIPFSASAQESSFFTPLMIPSLALWFDAADPGTITQSGGTVSEWRDKSSNAYSVFQPNASYRPTYGTNLLNGLPGVQLSGSRYLYQLGSNMPNFSSSPATTVYMVAKNGSTLAPLGWNFLNTMTYIGALSGTPRYFFSFYEENTPRLSLYTNDVLAGFNSSYFVPLNSNAIIGFAASATSNYLFFNGSNTAFTSTGAPPSANNETWFFFGDDNSNYVTDENIYEFVGFNTLITSAQQQAVEGYLATKWGLQSSLSNGHPYKITPLPFAPTFVKSPPYPTSIVNNPQFDPRLIPGCQLWLDASDTSTITGTTAVSAWTDKSGNGNNTTIFGTPNSTYGTINNVKAMWFNGSSGTYGLFSNTGATVSGFVVGTMNSATATYGRMIALGNNPGNDDSGTLQCPFLLRHIGNQAFSTRRFQTNYTYSSYTYDAPFLASIIYDGTNGNLYVNGSTIVQFGSTGNFGYSNYSVGCGIYSISANTVDTWAGFVGEVILYRSALTNTQRQQVEGSLSWKWGMQANLPANHPYKNSAPIGTTNPAGISRPANVLPIPSIACFPIRTYFLVTADLMLHVDAGNPASYPGSGSTWYDLTTSGLNVTLYNSPTYSSANGGYIAFTPSSSQYGGTSGTYNSGTALTRWTTEAWHYYTNTFVGNLSAIICSTFGGNVNFALGSPVGGAAGKNLAAAYYAGTWYYTSSSYTLPSVGWYHIVGTYDGTNLKLYVNNVLTQTQASAVTPGFGGGAIHLMRRWDVGDYWGGYLAIARIYKRALSADEVNTNYQLSKARFGLS